MKESLRIRKKQQMRQALLDSAYTLFLSKGYGATTLGEITAGANCAPRTFFQYFASKEELLLHGIDIYWDNFAKVLLTRSPKQTALEVTKAWMLSVAEEYASGKQPFMRMIAEQEDLAVRARVKLHGIERMRRILIPELAKDLSAKPDDVQPRVLAAMIGAIVDTYFDDPASWNIELPVYVKEAFWLLSVDVHLRVG